MKHVIILICVTSLLVGEGLPLSREKQRERHSNSSAVRLMRIPYGEKPTMIPLLPLGVDDAYESDERLEMPEADFPADGPYLLRTSEDGNYLAIYTKKKLILINKNLKQIEKEISGYDFYIDFSQRRLYSIFCKIVPKDYVDKKGVLHAGLTEEVWHIEVYNFNGNLLKSKTEMLTKALGKAVKAGWVPLKVGGRVPSKAIYVDRKGNVYLQKISYFGSKLPSILQINSSGDLNYINIKLPDNLIMSKNILLI